MGTEFDSQRLTSYDRAGQDMLAWFSKFAWWSPAACVLWAVFWPLGVYSLFIHPEKPEEELVLPKWLQVKQIGQLKQVVAEVIIIILFVLFLRVALQTFQDPNQPLTWLALAKLTILPVCTLLLALALRLVELHPKPQREFEKLDNSKRRDVKVS